MRDPAALYRAAGSCIRPAIVPLRHALRSMVQGPFRLEAKANARRFSCVVLSGFAKKFLTVP